VISTVNSIGQITRNQIQTGPTTTTSADSGVDCSSGRLCGLPADVFRGESSQRAADAASDPAVVWAAFKAGGGGYDRTASAGGGGYDRTASAGGGGYDVQVATGRTGATVSASAPR
jgi:hypothetical protein